MRRPKLFRCYRCRELRNGKPARSGEHWALCRECYDESQGVRRSSAELDEQQRHAMERDM